MCRPGGNAQSGAYAARAEETESRGEGTRGRGARIGCVLVAERSAGLLPAKALAEVVRRCARPVGVRALPVAAVSLGRCCDGPAREELAPSLAPSWTRRPRRLGHPPFSGSGKGRRGLSGTVEDGSARPGAAARLLPPRLARRALPAPGLGRACGRSASSGGPARGAARLAERPDSRSRPEGANAGVGGCGTLQGSGSLLYNLGGAAAHGGGEAPRGPAPAPNAPAAGCSRPPGGLDRGASSPLFFGAVETLAGLPSGGTCSYFESVLTLVCGPHAPGPG